MSNTKKIGSHRTYGKGITFTTNKAVNKPTKEAWKLLYKTMYKRPNEKLTLMRYFSRKFGIKYTKVVEAYEEHVATHPKYKVIRVLKSKLFWYGVFLVVVFILLRPVWA